MMVTSPAGHFVYPFADFFQLEICLYRPQSLQPVKLISWNVNGLRAVLGKGFRDFFEQADADVVCLQETKARPEQVDLDWLEGYSTHWNSAEKAGYSGTLVLSKRKPTAVTLGMGIDEHDTEGRIVTAEYRGFYLVNVYTPNAQNGLKRLDYRMQWDRDFLAYLKHLENEKPVLVCGDLNVAHQEIDLARPKANRKNAGFSDEERAGFDQLMEAGFIDTFRHLHPDEPEHYSWWSYRAGARGKNIGWRIDYWLMSAALKKRLKHSSIMPEVMGSDHCPVALELK